MWWVIVKETSADGKPERLSVLAAKGEPVEFAAYNKAQTMADKLGNGAYVVLVYT